MSKLTKQMIEDLGNKVVKICVNKGYDDTSVYFNGKRVHVGSGDIVFDDDYNYHFKDAPVEVTENCHPIDYFEYVNENHILSMAFEGRLYDLLNYGSGSKSLEKLFEDYGVYYELGNSWNLTLYPNDDSTEVEGVQYKRKPDPIRLRENGLRKGVVK